MSRRYDAADIEVLSGLEPVRRRPGMYTDTTRPNHLAHEVVDVLLREARVGGEGLEPVRHELVDLLGDLVDLVDVDGSTELGAMSLGEALSRAKQAGQHLVEVDASGKRAKCQLYLPGHFTVDLKAKQAHLTEEGHEHVEKLFSKGEFPSDGRLSFIFLPDGKRMLLTFGNRLIEWTYAR